MADPGSVGTCVPARVFLAPGAVRLPGDAPVGAAAVPFHRARTCQSKAIAAFVDPASADEQHPCGPRITFHVCLMRGQWRPKSYPRRSARFHPIRIPSVAQLLSEITLST